MIAFLIICAFIGLILAFFAAPAIIIINRQKLKEMDEIVAQYHSWTPDMRANMRSEVLRELTKIKNSLIAADKQSLEAARDKLNLV